jgi:hypothetical protein
MGLVAKLRLSPSTSAAPIAMRAVAVSSVVATLRVAGAVGPSLTAAMLTVTICSAVPPLLSLIRMVKLSLPFAFATGV